MRHYGEFCGVARALDLIGDRWSLLVIRELALRPCRYTDLRDGLPGIATNLLADRLRSLAEAGIVHSEYVGPPVASTVYTLTDWGAQLRPVLAALARWSIPLMATGRGDDHFRARWLVGAVDALYQDIDAAQLAAVTLRIDVAGESVLVDVSGTGVDARPCPPGQAADVVLRADPDTALAALAGHLDLPGLPAEGVPGVDGDADALARFAAAAAHARTVTSGAVPWLAG